MELVIAIYTVLAGLAYILWQCHKEYPGMLTGVLFFAVVGLGPYSLWLQFIEHGNVAIGIIGLIAHFAICIGYIVYACTTGMAKESLENTEIWDEINKLPPPDEKTLRAYKIANKIPLVPEHCEAYDWAAYHAWRVDEYNKRFRERHRLVTSFR